MVNLEGLKFGGLMTDSLKAYVAKADTKQIRVRVLSASFQSTLVNLGFKFNPDFSAFVKDTEDTTDKAENFSMLRDAGICFSAGREWSPSELFEYFREQGLVSGKYKRVAWKDPNHYYIEDA